MKAFVIRAPHQGAVEDVPKPKIEDNEVLLKVGACGICATDRHIFEGKFPVSYPLIPGHELAGEVVEVGPKVRGISVGDRVTIDPNIPCNSCYFCRIGRKHFCENWEAIGVTRDGGYAEYVRVPYHVVYRMPSDMPFEIGALTEPVACILHGIDVIEPVMGVDVAIFGMGPIGLMFIQLLRHMGASRIVAFEPVEFRREMALRIGADYAVDPLTENPEEFVKEHISRYGVDVVVEASGSLRAIKDSLRIVKPTGRILLFGVPPKDAILEIKPFDIYRNEITVAGSFTNPYTMYRAMEVLHERIVTAEWIITHKLSLDEVIRALKGELKDVIKAVVVP